MIGGIAKSPAAVRLTGLRWPLIAAVFVFILDAGIWYQGARAGIVWPNVACDFELYRDATFRWLSGGSFYHPYQFAPYRVWGHGTGNDNPILYPPVALVLFVPMILIAPLWWIVPLGIIGWVVFRAPRERWPLALALILWPQTLSAVWTGNPAIWVAAFVALATRFPFFAPFVLLKPSLAPFALYRIRERSWWIGLAAFVLLSLPFLPMWFDYLTVVRNQDQSLLYSLWQSSVVLVPLVGIGASRPRLPAWRDFVPVWIG